MYSLMILTYLVAVNGFVGMITFKPKYLEQIYGQSASKAIFLIGNPPHPWLLSFRRIQRNNDVVEGKCDCER